MTDTIRELCLAALKTSLESMTEGQPAGDPYSVTWSVVKRAPLDDGDWKKKAALGILDTEEQKNPRIQGYENVLRVVLEFRLFLNNDEDGSKRLNQVLGDIQRKIREDITLGGNAYNVVETGNETSLDDVYDHKVEGAVFLNIQYRHRQDDPRKVV